MKKSKNTPENVVKTVLQENAETAAKTLQQLIDHTKFHIQDCLDGIPEVVQKSKLWIEYHELAGNEIAKILSRWEAEWLENASIVYRGDAGEVWAQDILQHLEQWVFSQQDVEDLQEFTPQMLSMLEQAFENAKKS